MRTILIEDEPLAARRLQQVLRQHPAVVVEAVLPSIAEAVSWLGSQPAPDLIFADIQLEDGLSFEIFEAVPVPCPLVFTTSYDEYALKAFQLLSLDYLLKPIQAADMARALTKYAQLAEQVSPQPPLDQQTQLLKMQQLLEQFAPSQARYRQRFLVTAGEQLLPVPVEDIAYFFTQHEVVYLVRHDARKFALEQKLEKLESLLAPDQFFRLNRQFLVSMRAIAKIYTYFAGKLKIELQPARAEEVLVSRDRAPLLKRWLE